MKKMYELIKLKKDLKPLEFTRKEETNKSSRSETYGLLKFKTQLPIQFSNAFKFVNFIFQPAYLDVYNKELPS